MNHVPNERPKTTVNPLHRIFPLLATFIGVLVVAFATYTTISRISFEDSIPLVSHGILYLAWMVAESRVSREEVRRKGADYDGNTVEIAAAIKITLLVTLIVGYKKTLFAFPWVGLFLLCIGAGLRLWAIRSLASHYRHRIALPEKLLLVGPYHYIRHPAYLGTFIAHFGVYLMAPSALATLLIILWLSIVIIRTRIEERILSLHPDFKKYQHAVPVRLLPGLW